MKQFTRVADFMTAQPHWIELHQNLAVAAKLMKTLRVKQLPVLHNGKLRGTVSERDEVLVRSLELDPREVGVEEVMTAELYAVSADAPLGRVARAMSSHGYGCVVVMDGGRVLGVLTAADALRALAELLDRQEPNQDDLEPTQVRALVLSEHEHIRQLLRVALECAREVLDRDAEDLAVARLRSAARSAYTALVAHTQFEDRVFVPVVRSIDTWGPVRAEQLRLEHAAQRLSFDRALIALEDQAQSPAVLAASIEDLLQEVQKDMEREESELLTSDLLSGEIVDAEADGG